MEYDDPHHGNRQFEAYLPTSRQRKVTNHQNWQEGCMPRVTLHTRSNVKGQGQKANKCSGLLFKSTLSWAALQAAQFVVDTCTNAAESDM